MLQPSGGAGLGHMFGSHGQDSGYVLPGGQNLDRRLAHGPRVESAQGLHPQPAAVFHALHDQGDFILMGGHGQGRGVPRSGDVQDDAPSRIIRGDTAGSGEQVSDEEIDFSFPPRRGVGRHEVCEIRQQPGAIHGEVHFPYPPD